MATNETERLVHRGAGWYELPDGRKVRGRDMAERVLAFQAISPTTTGRLRFLRQAGLQYRGERDIYTTAGYVQEGAETFDHFWALYERNPIAGRIVDMPAKTTWRTPPEVFEGEEQQEPTTAFDNAFWEMADRLHLWRQFEKVDKLARVGRYAVLLIGVKDVEDRDLREEMQRLTNPADVIYLSSFAEKYATIQEWERDASSPRFGLPKLYRIELSGGVDEFEASSVYVHHSRIIHVAEDCLTDEVFGRPALKRCLNALFDLLKVSASTGEAYWQLAARVLQASVSPDLNITADQITAMGESLEQIVHDLRRQFVGQGVDLQWLSGTPPSPDSALNIYKALVAVASGIPERVLFGSERGELASSQDERNYAGLVNERQEHHAEPNVLRAFVDRMMYYNALPPVPEYTIVWPAMFELTEREIAEANLTRARAAKELTPVGGDPLDLVEIDEQRNVWLLPSATLDQRRDEQERAEADTLAEEEDMEEEAAEVAEE